MSSSTDRPTDNVTTPVVATDFGPVTVHDLEARAERARRVYMDTYTATTTLHDLWMATGDDPAFRETLDAVIDRIKGYRAVLRSEWMTLHRIWAEVAGIEPLPDDDTAPEDAVADDPMADEPEYDVEI